MPDDIFFIAESQNTKAEQQMVVIPVIEETVSISKKEIETGIVRAVKTVEEKEETVNLDLLCEEYEIEHVAVNRYFDDELPQKRQEGDTLIIPVLKEVLVKRVLLIEEIRITKKITHSAEQQKVTLRTETVTVSRTPAGNTEKD